MWEVELLVASVTPSAGGEIEEPAASAARLPVPDPFGSVPDELMDL